MAKAYLKKKEKFLWALFSGYILYGLNYAQMQTDSNAFITFETRETAMKAIRELNYTKLDDFPICFSHDDDETGRILIEGKTYVVAQDFDPDIEFSQIHDAFTSFWDIISREIITAKRKRQVYAYMIYQNVKYASNWRFERCLNQLNIMLHSIIQSFWTATFKNS